MKKTTTKKLCGNSKNQSNLIVQRKICSFEQCQKQNVPASGVTQTKRSE